MIFFLKELYSLLENFKKLFIWKQFGSSNCTYLPPVYFAVAVTSGILLRDVKLISWKQKFWILKLLKVKYLVIYWIVAKRKMEDGTIWIHLIWKATNRNKISKSKDSVPQLFEDKLSWEVYHSNVVYMLTVSIIGCSCTHNYVLKDRRN